MIEIKENVRIGDVILEAGDKIEVIKEAKLHYSLSLEIESNLRKLFHETSGDPDSMAFTVFSSIDSLLADDEDLFAPFVEKLKKYLNTIR